MKENINDFTQFLVPSETNETTEVQPIVENENDFTQFLVSPETTTSPITPPKKNTYEGIKSDANMRARAVRFAKNHLGHENIDEDEAVDEFLEHFRQFSVNEIYAGMDYNYVSGLATDAKAGNTKKKQELEDYRSLYSAYEQMPSFFEEGGSDTSTALLDYLGGIATAPSTYLSLLVPAAGKVAGQAAVATAKLGIGKVLSTVVANPLKSTAVIEGVGGALQDIGAQGTMIEANLQDDYSFGQTALATAITSVASVGVPLVMGKKKLVNYIERNTGDIVQESEDAIIKRTRQADINANTMLDKDKVVGQQVTDALNSLNKDSVEAGKAKLGEMATKEKLDASIRMSVKPEKFKQVAGALTELLGEVGGIKPGERITEALARATRSLETGTIKGSKKSAEEIEKNFGTLMKKYDITYDDLGNIFMADLSDAARLLQAAGQSKKAFLSSMRGFNGALDDVANFDIFGFSKEMKDVSAKLSKSVKDGDVRNYLDIAGDDLKDVSSWRRADAARLAFMTSQTATTFRNVVSGYSRVGMDILTQGLDNGLAKATGTKKLGPNSDVWAVAYGLTNKKEAGLVEEIFEKGFQDKASRMFKQLADIADVTGGTAGNHKIGRLENASRQLNALNTISDNMFKRAAFVGNLKRELNTMYTQAFRDPTAYKKASGKELKESDFDLIDIIKKGRFNDTFASKQGREALDRIIEDTLYFTYQKTPDSALAKSIISGIHSLPFVGTAFAPFPRFMMNAMRYTYEYSPVFLATNKQARGEILNVGKSIIGMQKDELITSYGNAAKGLVGTGMYVGATAFRMSEHAGENWYEGKTPEGKTYDLRPFFPAAPFLFFGDIAARLMKDEPVFKNRDTFASAIQALTGAQFKAGLGVYALEKAFDDLTNKDLDVGDKFATMGAEYFGNLFSTFTIPITAGQDLYNTFLAPDDERIVKDMNKKDAFSLLVNRSLQRIPANNAIEKNLEKLIGESTGYKAPKDRQSSTKEGLMRRVAPVTRQTAGLLLNEKKNKFESEMDRLKIRGYSKFPRTQNPEYDEMYGTIMDGYIGEIIVPFINSKAYKDLKDIDLIVEGKKVTLSKNERQRDKLNAIIGEVKKEIGLGLKNQITRINMAKKYKNYPKDVLDFGRLPQAIQTIAKQAYAKTYGAVASKNDYDYNKLLQLGKSLGENYPLNLKIE